MNRKAMLRTALCAVATLACAAAPVVFFRLADAALLGRTTAQQQPYTPPEPNGDDFYLLRQLCGRGGASISTQGESGLYVPGVSIVEEMPSDYTLNEEVIHCFDTLVEQGVLAQEWRQAALQGWDTSQVKFYRDKYYDTGEGLQYNLDN